MIQLNGQIITVSDTMNYIHKDKIANDDDFNDTMYLPSV